MPFIIGRASVPANMFHGDLGKREWVSRACATTRLTRLLEFLPQRRVLMILNYHRIGDGSSSPYDSGVFSATAEEFDSQIAYLKKRFHMATLGEVLEMVEGKPSAGASVLVTFDDGYVDNYNTAFPILRAHGVQGLFFLPTAFIGTSQLPWWDSIAYLVKHSRRPKIRLNYPEAAEFDLERGSASDATTQILRLYKRPSTNDHARFYRELEQACEAALPSGDLPPCFLTWDNAREMQAAGMAFGSHTHSHTILTTQSAAQQQEEFRQSREILERELKGPIDVLAYPVGNRNAFSPQSVAGLKATGYRAAFSFYGGLNRPGEIDAFDIRREAMSRQSQSRLRLQTSMGAITGSRWF